MFPKILNCFAQISDDLCEALFVQYFCFYSATYEQSCHQLEITTMYVYVKHKYKRVSYLNEYLFHFKDEDLLPQ